VESLWRFRKEILTIMLKMNLVMFSALKLHIIWGSTDFAASPVRETFAQNVEYSLIIWAKHVKLLSSIKMPKNVDFVTTNSVQ